MPRRIGQHDLAEGIANRNPVCRKPGSPGAALHGGLFRDRAAGALQLDFDFHAGGEFKAHEGLNGLV